MVEEGSAAAEDEAGEEERLDRGFGSLAAFRVAHLEFMQGRGAGPKTGAAETVRRSAEEIRSFLARGRNTGAVVEGEEDRRSAQRILDYWSAELVASPDVRKEDFSPVLLAPYVAGAPKETSNKTGGSARGADALSIRQDQSRQQIRLAALARQWRDGGKLDGYLLKGQALLDAKPYVDDPDIRELVLASEDAEESAARLRRWFLGALIALLATAAVAMTYLWLEARTQTKLAEEEASIARNAQAEAEREKAAADQAASQSEAARLEAERVHAEARARAAADARAINDRLVELEAKQKNLDTAMNFIRQELRKGNIANADLPPTIAEAIRPADVSDTYSDLTSGALAGYDAEFTGVNLPLPVLDAENVRASFGEGRAIDYVNYSLVLNSDRRTAFYAAVNLDRDKRRVLQRTTPRFWPDPRVPLAVQPDASWFRGNDIDRGHLAGRTDIAWGPHFDGDAFVAAQRLADVVDVYTNVTPQFDTFNQGVWSDLERWVLTEHNPSGRQVTIFSGPVFDPADPVVGGVKIPRHFWKIAVSTKPSLYQSDDSAQLVVDAFLVSQFRENSDQKADRTAFDPVRFRVPVAEIERLTGLRFDAVLREADRRNFPTLVADVPEPETPGELLARKVSLLDGSTAQERTAVAQEIVTAVRDQSMRDPEQKKVVAALVTMARDDSMRRLSPTGRLNLLFVLSQVPVESWNRPGWIDLKAGARRAVGDLERRSAAGETQIGQQTQEHLSLLKKRLGLDSKPAQAVSFQFAGLTREAAVEVSSALQGLGWRIPGEERTVKAAEQNEVRYSAGSQNDRLAAELLAADLRAAGQSKVCCAQPHPDIKPGTIEIWLSR